MNASRRRRLAAKELRIATCTMVKLLLPGHTLKLPRIACFAGGCSGYRLPDISLIRLIIGIKTYIVNRASGSAPGPFRALMAGRQAKIMTPEMITRALARVSSRATAKRDRALLLLSAKAGLRACEIARGPSLGRVPSSTVARAIQPQV
jgi:hypothetical protein